MSEFMQYDSVLRIIFCNYVEDLDYWNYDDVYAPYWRLYYNFQSGGVLISNGQILRPGPEDLVIVPGYLSFSSRSEAVFSQFYIHFTFDIQLSKELQFPFILPCSDKWLATINQFCLPENLSPERRVCRQLLAGKVLHDVLLDFPQEYFSQRDEPDLLVENARRLMTENMKQGISNEQLAGELGVGLNTLLRRFKAATGESPQLYLKRRRIEYACELLHFSNLSLEQVADKAGFANRYHFSRVFASIIGCGPAAFRKSIVTINGAENNLK